LQTVNTIRDGSVLVPSTLGFLLACPHLFFPGGLPHRTRGSRNPTFGGCLAPAAPPLPLPLPLRRRGLGRGPTGEWRASRTAEGSQDDASDSPPSRSALQGSSYTRSDGSDSCFLRGERNRRAAPGPPWVQGAGGGVGWGGHPLTSSPAGHCPCPESPWRRGCYRFSAG